MPAALAATWNIDERAFPRGGDAAAVLRFLTRYAILAPSTHNTQPWRFQVAGDTLALRADRARSRPVADPRGRELVMSCAAALFHLRLAARHFGEVAVVEPFPDRDDLDLVAEVRLGRRHPPNADEEALYAAIPRRHTNRRSYAVDEAIPAPLLVELEAAATSEGAWLASVGRDIRPAVADLVAEGDRAQRADRRFRRELAAWMRPNHSRRRDGIPGYGLRLPPVAAALTPTLVKAFAWGKRVASRDRRLAYGAAAIAVLGTDDDGPRAWLRSGQALDRILLACAASEIAVAFLNQPIEVPRLRLQLAALIGRGGSPQLMLRLGYAPPVKATPRRPVEDVVEASSRRPREEDGER